MVTIEKHSQKNTETKKGVNNEEFSGRIGKRRVLPDGMRSNELQVVLYKMFVAGTRYSG